MYLREDHRMNEELNEDSKIGKAINKALVAASKTKRKIKDTYKDTVDDLRVRRDAARNGFSADDISDIVDSHRNARNAQRANGEETQQNGNTGNQNGNGSEAQNPSSSDSRSIKKEIKAVGEAKYYLDIGGKNSKITVRPINDSKTASFKIKCDDPQFNSKYVTFDSKEYKLGVPNKKGEIAKFITFDQYASLSPKTRDMVKPVRLADNQVEPIDKIVTRNTRLEQEISRASAPKKKSSNKNSSSANSSNSNGKAKKTKTNQNANQNANQTQTRPQSTPAQYTSDIDAHGGDERYDESFNVLDGLNRRDRKFNEFYDLRDLYLSLNLTESEKKKVAHMLMENKSNKDIHDYMMRKQLFD